MKGEAPPAARQLVFEASSHENGSLKRECEEKDVPELSGVATNKTAFHHEPAGECLVCFDTLEDRNYAEYTVQPPRDSPQDQAKILANDKAVGDNQTSLSGHLISIKEDLFHTPVREVHSGGDDAKPSRSVTTAQSVVWYPAKFCVECIEELRSAQFQRYCDSVANTTCAREQRALLKRGPPVNLRDRMAFPESNDQEIHSLWYAVDNTVRPAKLKGSLEGEERQALWNRLQQFLIEDEAADEGDGKRAENS